MWVQVSVTLQTREAIQDMQVSKEHVEYLKSEAAEANHEAALDKYFDGLKQWHAREHAFLLVDVNEYRDLVAPGVTTFITSGLSGFVLHDVGLSEIGRREMVISIPTEFDDLQVAKLLDELCGEFLDRTAVPGSMTVIDSDYFRETLGGECSIAGLFCYYGVFLPMKFRSFCSGAALDLETEILELIPVTANEINLINDDVEEFKDRASRGEIDLLDVFRG